MINSENAINITGISGELKTLGTTNVTFCTKNIRFSFRFQVFKKFSSSLKVDGIIGSDFLDFFKADICFSSGQLKFNKRKYGTIPLYRQNEIIRQPLAPQSRSYIQMMTDYDCDVVINDQKICHNVFLHGGIFSSKNHVLTLIIDNNNFHEYELINFKPNIEVLSSSYTTMNVTNTVCTARQTENRVDDILKQIHVDETDQNIKNILTNLCSEYSSVFNLNQEVTSKVKNFQHEIHLKPHTVPIYIRQYKLPPAYREVIADKVQQMVDADLAEPSYSAWNAPVLLVPKKGCKDLSEYRLVIDYRKLNDVVKEDKFPIPNIDDILDGLSQSKFFSTLDLNQGYYQVPLEESSRPCTAFSTSEGHFQLKVMPMGLKTSPSSFSRMMLNAFRDLIGKACYIYLDDIIVFGKDLKQHTENLKLVFDRLKSVNLQLKPSKCKFFRESVTYLGHLISSEGIRPDPAKYEPILNWPTPKTVKQLQSFIGLTSYYRRFVKNFSQIASPLYALTKKNAKFNWTPACQEAFDTLKQKVTSPPVIAFPDFSEPFILQTDASEKAIGAVLMNYDRKPIAFISRAMKPEETRYHITDQELLAIVWAVKKFEHYLLGQKFEVETDHKALESLFKESKPNSRWTRFRLKLGEYDFKVKHITGKSNVVADALSRVETTIDELKQMTPTCNVVTRQQAKAEKEKEKLNEPSITKLLRVKNELPLIKICESFDEMTNYCKDDIIVDKTKTVGYYSEKGLIFIALPRPSTTCNWKDVLHNVQIGLESVCNKANIKKLAIMEDELKKVKNVDEKFFLKSLSNENLRFFVIPSAIKIENKETKERILEYAHKLPTGGHLGVNKMFNTLKLRYYWPNMRRDIENTCRHCPVCQRSKHAIVRRLPMALTHTSDRFEKIFMDVVGPLVETNTGYKYILTIQDDLTKFLVVVPLYTKTASEVAQALVENFFLKYHFPKYLVTDFGSENVNILQSEVCKLLKIQHITSAPYHHQTVGALENSHKSLGNYLRAFAQEDKFNWDSWLPYFCFSYNNTVHASTGYTPSELVFGENNSLPDGVERTLSRINYNIDDFAKELPRKLKIALEEAKKHQEQEKNKRKIIYDRENRTISKQIEIGSKVLVRNQVRSKLDNVWKGPFVVGSVDDFNAYITINNKLKKINLNDVKIFYDPQDNPLNVIFSNYFE